MSNRNSNYTTVRQIKKNMLSKGGPKVHIGKRNIYFTIGGKGITHDLGIKVGSKNFWNPGRSLPSLKYSRN